MSLPSRSSLSTIVLLFLFATLTGIVRAKSLPLPGTKTARSQIIIWSDIDIDMTLSPNLLTLGQQLVVSTAIDNNSYVQGCTLTSYEIALEETQETPHFEFTSPSTVIGIENSATFTLTTTSTGTAIFSVYVQAFYNCDDQIYITLDADETSNPVYIWTELHEVYLPVVFEE